MNVKELQARYPFVTLEDKGNTIKIVNKNMSFNVSKDDEQAEDKIAEENLKTAKENLLSAMYPYLYFSVHGFVNVWVCRIYHHTYPTDRYVRSDHASVRFNFQYPPDEAANQKLTELNEQAKLASQEGMFFCTKCQTAKPKAEYGGFYFAEQRCKGCADSDWLKTAREETYD